MPTTAAVDLGAAAGKWDRGCSGFEGVKKLHPFILSCQRSQRVTVPKHWTSVFCLAAGVFRFPHSKLGSFLKTFLQSLGNCLCLEIGTEITATQGLCRGCVCQWANPGCEILSAYCCKCMLDAGASNDRLREGREGYRGAFSMCAAGCQCRCMVFFFNAPTLMLLKNINV